MPYHVSRNGQVYGPYSLADLQRYVASGNVLLADLAKSEDMPEWLPVSQVLAVQAPAHAYIPGSLQPGYPPPGAAYPNPPDLAWGLVLLFSILTCSIFSIIWNLVLAAWFNKVQPASKILLYYIVATVFIVVQSGVSQHHQIAHHTNLFSIGMLWEWRQRVGYSLLALITWIIRLIARFNFRSALEQHYNTVEPIGLHLNGVMTFFFGGLYFQYHLNRINEIKRAMYYRNAAL
jgi:hypothetical protein